MGMNLENQILLELGKLGGWGVSILLIVTNAWEKRREKETLLSVIKNNAEAMTKLVGAIEQNTKMLEQQQNLLMNFFMKG